MAATIEYTDGRRTERPKAPLFTCKSERAIGALKFWARRIDAWAEINATAEDSLGFPLIKLRWQNGDRWEMAGVIVCDSQERRDLAVRVLEKEQRRRERELDNG